MKLSRQSFKEYLNHTNTSNRQVGNPIKTIINDRPSTIKQRKLQQIINNKYKNVWQLKSTKSSKDSNVIQRVEWADWNTAMGSEEIDDEIKSMAKFGMSLINFFQARSIKARIGGSLNAAMFGGGRKPQDIDIDIETNDIADIKTIFKNFMNKKKMLLVESDAFFIDNYNTPGGVYEIEYYHTTVDQDFDEYDNEEVQSARKKAHKSTPHKVKIDLSSEGIFVASNLDIESHENNLGYFTPEFMIVTYLNRLAKNKLTPSPDEKNDSQQIKDLLVNFLKRSLDEKYLKESILRYVGKSKNKNEADSMSQLLDQLIKEAVESLAVKR